MPPAARISDMHTCPMVTGVVPHVGGPILPAGEPTVLIGYLPAARVSDMAVCTGPPDLIMQSSMTVLVGKKLAARLGDMTAHGGVIVLGSPTVLIGDGGASAVGGASIMGSAGAQRAVDKYEALSPEDREKFKAMLANAKTENERLWLFKALGAGHSVADIGPFADRIRGSTDQWQQDNLRLSGSSTGRGVQQQWSMSCNATATQAVKGERDPMYALKTHDDNPNFDSVDSSNAMSQNPNLATEQGNMLGSNYTGARGPMSGSAPTNRDQGGSGRWNDDLLNANSGSTGTTYSPADVNNPGNSPNVPNQTTDQAINDIDKGIANGEPVPIVVGDHPGEMSHYVVVTGENPGPPPAYTVHDPGAGTTSTVPVSDMRNGTMNAGGYSTLNAYENPSSQ